MAFINIKNVKICGLSACVPERVVENADSKLLSDADLRKYIETTGVERKHCVVPDGSICTSDLCYKATEELITRLGWSKDEIDAIIFVSHTTDYKLPATACIMQDRLGIPDTCMAFDITLGCSGFIYGLSVAGSLLSGGTLRKALLMVGNTQSVYASPQDKSMSLLLGDAGTVTALEYNEDNPDTIQLNLHTDGSGKDFLMVPDGGCRNPVNERSFDMEEFEEGIYRTRLHEKMDGLEVFSFGLTRVPRAFRELFEHFSIDTSKIDYLCLHQANRMLCEKIRMKLKVDAAKTPYNIAEFGNTSGATVPLLMVTELGDELRSRPLNLLCTGFGVGLSWGTAHITTDRIVVPELMSL